MVFVKNLALSFLVFGGMSFSSAEESPWEFTGAAGLSYTEGNADSIAYSLQFLGTYQEHGNEIIVGADYFYAEDNNVQATDSLKLHGQYNRDITERFYFGGFGSYFRDTVADIDYRIDSSLLLGYRVIAEDDMTLSFEAGPGYTWRERGSVRDDFATLRLNQKFEYKFSKLTRFWQSVSFIPRVDDLSDYVMEAEVGLETRVTDQLSLRTFMRHRMDSTPAVGKGESDTALLLGLSYDFNGLPEPGGGGRKSLFPGLPSGGDDDDWKTIAALGLNANRGNADSAGVVLSIDSEYKTDEREVLADLAYTARKNNGATAEDQTIGRLQYNHFVSRRFYSGATIGYFKDGEAEIDYRATPGFLLGYYLMKSDDTSLALEGGPAYTFESIGGQTNQSVSVFLAERFSHQFTEQVSFTQVAEYTGSLEDFSDYSVLVTAALDTKITDQLIWRVSADYTYESRPAAGRVNHDSSLTSSIAVKF